MISRFATALALVFPLASQDSRPASRPEPDERVWEGYLFKDKSGRTQLGRPVISMGVIAQAPQVLDEDLAKRLTPLVSAANSEYVFLNYELEKEGGPAQVPHWLVTLRGRVAVEEEEGPVRSIPSRAAQTLIGGRLAEVERLPEAWLAHWSLFFRDRCSPFRVARDPEKDADKIAAFAATALTTLRAMRAVPGCDAAEQAKVREIEPSARVVEKTRRRHETSIHRWLVEAQRKNGWNLEGLGELGPLPPSSIEVQRWFLEAKDKRELLARVAKEWAGSLDTLELVHYVGDERASSYATTWLRQVREDWSDELFARHQATTRRILGGR